MGDGYHPDSLGKQFGDVVKTLLSTDGSRYLDKIRQEIPNTAKAELEAAQQTSGGYNQLSIDNQQKYGTQLNDLANKQVGINQQAAAANDLATLQGSGGKLIGQTQELLQKVDPEYYASRAMLGGKIDALGKNLSADVTPTERAELDRYLNRSAVPGQAANSQINTLGNAMKFGQLGADRTNQLVANIGRVAQALPQLRSGVDLFGIGTGRQGLTGNIGQQQFGQGYNMSNGPANEQVASNTGSNMFNMRDSISKQRAAGYRTIGDQVEQGSRIFSNVASGAASLSG